jgi:enamine deaminase RidA (YjgF/YER057c/UK114 family)
MPATSPSARLAELGIELPSPRPPAGAYSPVVVDGDIAYTSGLVAVEGDQIAYIGQLGATLDVAEGKKSARGAALLSLGTLATNVGGLDRVQQVLKVTGYVRAVPDFGDLPAVMDGASELLIDLFGESGRSARSTVGVAALPRGASVEMDMVVRLTPA